MNMCETLLPAHVVVQQRVSARQSTLPRNHQSIAMATSAYPNEIRLRGEIVSTEHTKSLLPNLKINNSALKGNRHRCSSFKSNRSLELTPDAGFLLERVLAIRPDHTKIYADPPRPRTACSSSTWKGA